MSDFTLKFDGWAPDLQNVAIEVDGSAGSVPAADCLNVYFQDAAFRCLPGPNPFGPSLGIQALNLFSGYDNIKGDNYVYAATANGIQLLQDGAWSSIPIEPSVTVTLTGIQIGLTTGGATMSAAVAIPGQGMQITAGNVTATGGFLFNGTLVAGSNGAQNPLIGYFLGQYGSLTPGFTYAGVSITSLYCGPFGTQLTVPNFGLPKNYFTTLAFPSIGRTLPTSSAIFTGASNYTQWVWSTNVGLRVGSSYSVRLIA